MRRILLAALVLGACAQAPVEESGARQLYRLVVDSRPGSLARLEIRREGATRTLEVPVIELDTVPRA